MEFLLDLENSDSEDILERCNVLDEYLPLDFVGTVPQYSYMYRAFNDEQIAILKTQNVTFNWHT